MPEILIIEDNKKLALFIEQFLQKKGFKCELSYDGVSALQRFAQKEWDLLIVDIKLPLMDGNTLCKKIRESKKGARIPVIMMSGFVTDYAEIRKITDDLNVTSFLVKPFSFDNLYGVIKKILPESISEGRVAVPPVTKDIAPAEKPLPHPKEKPAVSRIIRGQLGERPFEALLSLIGSRRMNGILMIGRELKKKKFYIVDGAPVEAEILPEEESFGNYLIHKGLISMVELRAYEEMKAKEGDDPRDIFIKMGSLSTDQFLRENRMFLVDNLIECFSWRKGIFVFDARPAFIRSCHSSSVDMPYVFYQGFRQHLSPEEMSRFLAEKGDLYIGRTPEFYSFQNHLTGEEVIQTVFALLDGTRSTSDIINSLDVEDESALAAIYTLNYLKMISFSERICQVEITVPFPVREAGQKQKKEAEETVKLEEEFEDLGEELNLLADELDGLEEAGEATVSPEADNELAQLERNLSAELDRIKDCNYYEIFGLTQGTYSFNDLKKSYFELTRNFGPEKFFASSGEVMTLAEDFLSKVSTAYNTLSDVVSKESYDELLGSPEMDLKGGVEEKKFQVQIQFQSGKVFMEEGKYENAQQAFTNCINIYPEKPEYYAYLALATYNNPLNKGNKTAVEKAKELINRSLKYGKISIAFALKGTILMDEGNLTLAESEFNKALRINPNNKTAMKKMETIREMRDQNKKGIFMRMFK